MTQYADGMAGSSAFSFRNKIINGGFDVWQRGTSFSNQTTSGAVQYSADRWLGNRASDVNGQDITRVAGTAGKQRYAYKWQRTSGNTSTATMSQFYAIANEDCAELIGNYATLSFCVKAGANYSGGDFNAIISYGTGTDQREYSFTGRTQAAVLSQAITTTSTRYSVTTSAIIPTSATQVGVLFTWIPSGTAGADDSVTLEEVQLEAGSVATPFEARPYGVELALCQRYYYREAPGASTATFSGSAYSYSGTIGIHLTKFPVTMRASPSALEQNGTAGDYEYNESGITQVTCNSVPSFSIASNNSALITLSFASGPTVGRSGYLRCKTGTSAAYLGWSAEL